MPIPQNCSPILDCQYRYTLSTGKKLVVIKAPSHYQQAVNTCEYYGADVLLPISAEENNEVHTIIGGNPIIADAWIRVINLEHPTTQRWADDKNNGPLAYRGKHGITAYPTGPQHDRAVLSNLQ